MATEALLTSETFVKEVSSISDNIAGKYLRPSIREAQDIAFRRIVGDALLSKLKALVTSGDISAEGNSQYRELLDRAQYFIAYSAITELAVKVSFKIANAGVVKTPDEKVETASQPDMEKLRKYYQDKADAAGIDLQNWMLANAGDFPELGKEGRDRIGATLHSAASCGIFLGGPRGKRY